MERAHLDNISGMKEITIISATFRILDDHLWVFKLMGNRQTEETLLHQVRKYMPITFYLVKLIQLRK